MSRSLVPVASALALAFAATPAAAQMRITEWMYSGATTEYIEFTNVGTSAIDFAGWSFDDDGRVPDATPLSAFGTVRPGESMLLVEGDAEAFRTAWGLCAATKIIGGNANNLGRNDEINLFDGADALVDRLTYGDQSFPGTIRTQNAGGWVSAAGLGANLLSAWTLATAGDAEGSVVATGGDIGSPGRSTRASTPFDPCASVGPMMRITEYMYDGAPGEFVEFTNVGDAAADFAGWGFDDDDATQGRVDLSAFGTVAPGESVILTEADATAFRGAWQLCGGVKVIGGLTQNLGRNDAIHLTDAASQPVDDLDFGDTQFPGTIRTQNASGWVSSAGLGQDDPAAWTLSSVGDPEGSLLNASNVPGSPGRSTRAIVTFDPCATTPGAPTITVDPSTTDLVDLPANVGGAVSGVIGDPTDPAATLGIAFALADDGDVDALDLAVASSDATVVPNDAAHLVVAGTGASRTLRIVPAGVGHATITVTVRDAGNLTGTYVIAYAASAASATPDATRFHTGASDASAVVAVDAETMLVADDEDEALRLYARDASGLFFAAFDMAGALAAGDEVDIEGATRVGDRVFWTGSHGNDKDGDLDPARRRLFATDLAGAGLATTATYVDRYDFLRDDLLAWDAANGHGLGANALGFADSAAAGVRPDVANGFNIEGLTMAPDGTTAWLAFRAPLLPVAARSQGLLVPVANVDALVVDGTAGSRPAGSASFGTPVLLDLGGRAIRSIDRGTGGDYLIVAGPPGADTGVAPNDFRLFAWSGVATDAPREITNVDLTARATGGSIEGLLDVPATFGRDASFQLVVDNGDTVFYADGVIAKDLAERRRAKFRSEAITADLGDAVFDDGFEDDVAR